MQNKEIKKMSLLDVFDEIVTIIHNDYAGLIEKKGWDKPEIYRSKLLKLENDNNLDRDNFQEIVKDYLFDLNDKHVGIINKSETKPRMTNGFKVRRFQDKLYITQIQDENKLKKGMKILKIDNVDILNLVEPNKRILKSELAEREEWENVLIKAKSCLIEDENGNNFDFSLNKYIYKSTPSNYSLEILEKETLFVRVNDFMEPDKLLNLIAVNKDLIASTKNLIIDLRVNSGGYDNSYDTLIQYIFPPKITLTFEGIFIYMTERNYKNRYNSITEFIKTLKDTNQIDQLNKYLVELKSILNKGFSEIESSKSQTIFIEGSLLPKNVVILIDRYCGSSGDQFALYSTFSTKTKLIGRNTSGGFEYGNVAFEDFKEYDFQFMYPTTKSKRVMEGRGLDNIGISPNIYVPWTPEHLEQDIDLKIALDYLKSL